jgi:hypothetical protein
MQPSFYASRLYDRVLMRGWMGKVWSRMTGDSNYLLDLVSATGACTMQDRHSAGVQIVQVSQIRGSEGRCTDFDAAFRPLRDGTAYRWRGIAEASIRGDTLPPVELIRVGEVYFVRDGHHRVSVARALRQPDIDAVVTVWNVSGVLPTDQSSHRTVRAAPTLS